MCFSSKHLMNVPNLNKSWKELKLKPVTRLLHHQACESYILSLCYSGGPGLEQDFVSVSVSVNQIGPCWMRILQTGWHVVYRLVFSLFSTWFSAHISEDSSSLMAPRDALWWGGGCGKGLPNGSRDELREVSKGGSTKELQVADFFSDLQLEDLLEDLLP